MATEGNTPKTRHHAKHDTADSLMDELAKEMGDFSVEDTPSSQKPVTSTPKVTSPAKSTMSNVSTRSYRSFRKMTDEELQKNSGSGVNSPPETVPEESSEEEQRGVEDKLSGRSTPSTTSTTPLNGFKRWFSFGKVVDAKEITGIMRQLQQKENFNLALSRFKENSVALQSQPEKDREAVNIGANNLRKTFNEIKTGIEFSHDEMLIKGIDWEFWSKVVNDYSAVVGERPRDLLDHISQGIPIELRGMVWQLICNSKSSQLEDFYRDGKTRSSSYEKLIKRDLARTSFVTDSKVSNRIEELFDIIKCYSLYDNEVGYTQGMAFITVPLLMNMDASEAFCMLVKLMNNYSFRQLYLPEMPGLHLKLYQFDRLIEDQLPDLYYHLQSQGVRSSMYATQWFLTLFGYKFPLEMVLRIYDIVIAEGIESILRFAFNLMEKNCNRLLSLKFDQLLRFLKEEIFYRYLNVPETAGGSKITAETYRLDDFVNDSMHVNIVPITLNQYEAEFEEIQLLEDRRNKDLQELRMKNSELLKEIRKIEAAYATLNKEHVGIAGEMVDGKVAIANLDEENDQLRQRIDEATNRLTNLDNQTDTNVDFRGEISNGLDLEIQKTMEENSVAMEENATLEEQLAEMEAKRDELLKKAEKRRNKWALPKTGFW